MNKPAVTDAKEFRVALNTSVPFEKLDTDLIGNLDSVNSLVELELI